MPCRLPFFFQIKINAGTGSAESALFYIEKNIAISWHTVSAAEIGKI
jgi:hypothetical protein